MAERLRYVTNSLRVERKAVPFLNVNPNLKRSDEPHLYVYNFMNDQEIKNADAAKKSAQKVSPKYPTFIVAKDAAQLAKEEEVRQKQMRDAEKLRPVTLIRSQQGHRFSRKIRLGDTAM